MRRRLPGYGLAFFGGVLLHFGFRGTEPMPEQEPGIAPRPVGQQDSRAGFTATRDLFRASRGLQEAARLLERIESAGPAAFPRLYALFAMERGIWLEILEEEWAEQDPRGLLAYRLGLAHIDDLDGTVLRVFDALSVSEPREVFGLLAMVPGRATRDELHWRLLSNLAVADRAGATEFLAAHGAAFARAQLPDERGDGLAILRFGELVETINGIPDSATRAELLRNLFRERRWDAENPGLVLAWCGIADPDIAATLFQPDYNFVTNAGAEVIAAVSRRVDEVLKTQVTYSGPMLDAVSLWTEADRAAVFRSFSKNDYLLISSDDPPLTPAQRDQIRAIAAAYISDPEKRARFLQYVE